uniref:Dehydrogenase/reductase 2 n=1 Tax=Spermophilus dauricus TaxID=99837 RepID=A0A8C9PE02_SPEDA
LPFPMLSKTCVNDILIGFSIARRLAQEGAHVIISSRKQQNVDQAVDTLQREGLSVAGTVCHVGKAEDQEQLVATLTFYPLCPPRQGSVVLVSSVAAYVPLLGAYNVSKTALLGLTKTLAVELAPKNIRVNCLVPGFIKTDFSRYSWESVTSFTHLLSPCRVGKPEDCAGLVSFLCSPDASYITGENIVIAGFSPHL